MISLVDASQVAFSFQENVFSSSLPSSSRSGKIADRVDPNLVEMNEEKDVNEEVWS